MYIDRYKGNQIESIILICCTFLILLIGTFSWSAKIIIAAIGVMVFAVFVAGRNKLFYTGMMAAWFILDQVYFDVLGGTFRAYFACSLLIIFILIRWLPQALRAPNILTLAVFLAYTLFSALFSAYINGAVKSSLFLVLNALTAFSVFALIYSDVLSEMEFSDVLRKLLTVSIVFGLLQFVVYRFTAIGIGFSPSTATQQLSIGQITGFRTEANTHGKLVAWTIVYCIPPIINRVKSKKYRNLLFLAVISMAISMTRSALYAMFITLFFMMLRYLWQRGFYSVFKIASLAIVAGIVVMAVLVSGVMGDFSYSLYKIQNLIFINVDSLNNDVSASFRLYSLNTALEIWRQSFFTMLFGVGYGQTWTTLRGMIGETRAGATDVISVLTGTGIFGLVLFFVFNFQSWKLANQTMRLGSKERRVFAEQILYCSIYGFCICFFSGILQCPEFWITIGCCAALGFNKLEVAVNR